MHKIKDISNNKQTIHDFDINIIYEYFTSTERQGPGNAQETLKALSFIHGLTENSKIADIGCGTGGQTMTLGNHTPCEITGYLPVATYMLPETIWTDYYSMQASRFSSFLEKHKGNKTAEEFIASQRYEAELYYKYKAYYGYMFYIGKKI